MRADLVARGLLDAEFRLTEAGHAHVDALIGVLLVSQAPCEPDKPRVKWNYQRSSAQKRAA